MTNREWLIKEMQNMSDEGISYILKNPCTIFANVDECDDTKNRLGTNILTCRLCAEEWLKAEHKEKPKLSDAERVILENVDKNYKWIARDNGGNMHVFKCKPTKLKNYWHTSSSYSMCAFNHLFQFITWSDSEPYNIEELLKGDKNND